MSCSELQYGNPSVCNVCVRACACSVCVYALIHGRYKQAPERMRARTKEEENRFDLEPTRAHTYVHKDERAEQNKSGSPVYMYIYTYVYM